MVPKEGEQWVLEALQSEGYELGFRSENVEFRTTSSVSLFVQGLMNHAQSL